MAEPAAFPPVIALFGPTGMGKTEIAIALAESLDAEIVSADSMQVYRGLAIVTNQPTAEQLARVPHHLVGIVDPREEFSVARYAGLAQAAIDDVLGRGRRVVVAGGSGLYLRAALGGLTFGGPPSAARRPLLETLAATDPGALRERLRQADPAVFAAIDAGNPRRLVRAVEALETGGRSPAPHAGDALWSSAGLRWPTRLLALEVDRQRLRERVEERVEEMARRGLLDEIAALPRPLSRTVAQAIGVREMLAVLAGELSLDDALAGMKARTRGYVRRQLTWMRKLNADIIPTSARPPESVAREIARRLSRQEEGPPVPTTWRGPGKMQFSTWQGLGNKYIVLHHEEIPFELTPERVRLLCDRDFGIGSDGILVIGARLAADRFGLRIFNPDGSEAEMCGNGVRMVARKLKMEGSITGDRVVLETGAGEIVPVLQDGYSVRVDMGLARFGGEKLAHFSGDAVDEKLTTAGRTFQFTFVDVGNPHAVIHSPWPLELVPLHEVGPAIEAHRYFPRKANVEFVVPIDAHNAKIRVWERGVGETRACGTGATATAVALVRSGTCTSPVTVELPGGKLEVEVAPDWRVHMTGPAEEIYHGDLSLEFLEHLA